jgi:RNA polymerase sigma-70 factor, ECF subfamily
MTADDGSNRASDSITRWVREHALAVRAYLLGTVRRPDVADDLLQETFQRAWQARDRYRDDGHERAYLLRIADRLVIDRSRRLGVEINVDEAIWNEVEPAAKAETPLDEMARGETNEALTMALSQLSLAQRRVLLLRYFGDLTFEEIAETLHSPLGTVLSHCRRGLAAMRKLLGSQINTAK